MASVNPATRVVARAPGRVNLIGEHTDYNDGFVLPMALPFRTEIRIVRRPDRRVTLRSPGYGRTEFGLDDDPAGVERWARYVAGMARLLADAGLEIPGFDAELATDIPVGASLSSSAALEVGAGFGLSTLAGVPPDPTGIAQLGQRVENEMIGIQSGIMDQLISAIATDGAATLIDCRTLEGTAVPIPADVVVVIMDTMTRRELADSEYDDRRSSCERAAATLRVPSLRDATLDAVMAMQTGVDRTRALHVVTENQRVLDAVAELWRGDAAAFGRLMGESHRSLRDDYEVSSPALDLIVELANRHEACLGARMTGGGFGGCAVALVERGVESDFVGRLRTEYRAAQGTAPDVWVVEPSAGASAEVVG